MKQNMQILSIDKITAEATADAQRSSNADHVCPYPRDSAAASIYKKHFEAERKNIDSLTSDAAAQDIMANLHTTESAGPHATITVSGWTA